MQMQDVLSSHIAAVGYDGERRELFVSFKSGVTYSFADVPAEEAHKFMHAPSIGKHFGEHIRPKFNGTRINHMEGKTS